MEQTTEEWENSFSCDTCGNENHKDFTYGWTAANGEIWYCKLCPGNTIVDEHTD